MTVANPTAANEPIGFECKFATYVEAQDGSENDMLVVKEYAHMPDGTTVPNLRMFHNYERHFWVTREGNRNHEDKKEWEDEAKLMRYTTTEIGMSKAVARALGRAPSGRGDMRMLKRSPYLYGCDISTPTLVKRRYMDQWPTAISTNTVAALDSEADMVHGHGEIIMLSLTKGSNVILVVVKEFLEGVSNPIQQIREAFTKYLGDYEKSRKIVLEVELVENAGECTHRILQKAHEWQPDLVSIWNINYDLPKMIQALEKYGFDLAATFSDPRVPDKFKYFKYKEGKAQKVTASGKTMALHPAEQWHTVFTPASFYFLDSMCVYLKLRIAKGKEASYALDYILNKHLGIRKLKFEEANHVHGANWHTFMQKHFKVEYCIYNLFDSISLELLDEEITDLKRMITALCEHSELHRFPSQPRRTCDDLHFFVQKEKKVVATTSDKMEDELDDLVVPLTEWIVTLDSYMVSDDGLKVLTELPDTSTLFYAHVADLDVEGTYPNVEIIANISKETTARELSQIRGVTLQEQRAIGINMSGGHVNATEFCRMAYKAPSYDTLLAGFCTEKGLALPAIVEREPIQNVPETIVSINACVNAVTAMIQEFEEKSEPDELLEEEVADEEFESLLLDIDLLTAQGKIDVSLRDRIHAMSQYALAGLGLTE